MVHQARWLRPLTIAPLLGVALMLAAFTAAAQTPPTPTTGAQSTPVATKAATTVATAATTSGSTSTTTTTTTTDTGTNWTPILIVVLIVVVIILAVGLAVRRPWISDVP